MILQFAKPTLLLDESKARANITRMATKAKAQQIQLRPHFKTHQSAVIGQWFQDVGVTAVTVSSVTMAQYFAAHGWDDITIAFPVNVRQLDAINKLAGKIRLGVLVESTTTAVALNSALTNPVDVWLKIDAGYGRTGLVWSEMAQVTAVAQTVAQSPQLRLRGILTHSGHTYSAESPADVVQIYDLTAVRMNAVQQGLANAGLATTVSVGDTTISVGDTPGCSIVNNFGNVDEIRPGNFVFYDLMQQTIGACHYEDIAVGVACPIVAKHAPDQRLILYGGGVHLSKESLRLGNGRSCYGRVALLHEEGWSAPFTDSLITSISQEHGVVQAEKALFDQVDVGDVLLVLPVHSCMTVDLYPAYHTLDGQTIPKMMTNFDLTETI